MSMKELFIASNNAHKIYEIGEILKKNGFETKLLCPRDFNDHDEPVEDGNTYAENAYIKAKHYYDKYGYPTLADDSGISIDYFGGRPNIHSSRFLGQFSDQEKNEKVLEMMKNVKNRKAVFEAVICFIQNDDVRYYHGENPGEIALEAKGEEGFGYDPIFLIPAYGKTEAELGDVYKNENSHRARALKKWVNDLEK